MPPVIHTCICAHTFRIQLEIYKSTKLLIIIAIYLLLRTVVMLLRLLSFTNNLEIVVHEIICQRFASK